MTMPTVNPRTFAQTLETLRFGTLGDELTDALRDLTAICASTGKAGELKLTIKLKPGKGGQIEVIDDYAIKAPKEERGTTLMFATPENFLQRDDPRQLTLDGLRTVDQETGELRRVPAVG
jgi:hypothetical protein